MPTPSDSPSSKTAKRIGGTLQQVSHDYNLLEVNRKRWHTMLATYAGRHVTKDCPDDMKVNKFHRAVRSVVANVAFQDPLVEIIPVHTGKLFGLAQILSSHATHRVREIRLRNKARVALLDALMFTTGMFKIGTTSSRNALTVQDFAYDTAQGYVNRISPRDQLIDTSARDDDQITYLGHRHCAKVWQVESVYPNIDIDTLPRKRDEDRDILDRSWRKRDDDEDIDLIDLWLAPGTIGREAKIVTVAGPPDDINLIERGGKAMRQTRFGMENGKPIRIREYDGHSLGGYELVRLAPIPDTIMGTPPAGFWMDLAQMIGQLADHIFKSELKAKKVLLGPSGSESDLATLTRSRHLDTLSVNQPPDSFVERSLAGTTPTSVPTLGLMENEFSQESASDTLSGAGPSSGKNTTATEVEDIRSRLGVMLDDIADQFNDPMDRVIREFVYQDIFTNPGLDTMVTMNIKGVSLDVPFKYSDLESREFLDWNYRVVRGSMRRVTDQQKAAFLERMISTHIPMVLQLAPMGLNPIYALQKLAGGVLTPAEIEAMLPAGVTPQQQLIAAGGEGMENLPVRKPGMPGTDAIRNSNQTGANSVSFDRSANTQATMAAI